MKKISGAEKGISTTATTIMVSSPQLEIQNAIQNYHYCSSFLRCSHHGDTC